MRQPPRPCVTWLASSWPEAIARITVFELTRINSATSSTVSGCSGTGSPLHSTLASANLGSTRCRALRLLTKLRQAERYDRGDVIVEQRFTAATLPARVAESVHTC
jgi:hypothetical protein